MRQTVQLAPAHLLALRPYGDSSLLIEAFSADHGRVGLIARGARAPRSRLKGVLQLFVPLLLSWRSGGELGTLTAAEASGPPVLLAGERIFYGWYCNELLLRLLQRGDPHPALYATHAVLLPELAADALSAQSALRRFEKRLLAEIGYGLMLPAELDADARYRYDWEKGPVAADDGYPGVSLIALRDEQFDEASAQRDARDLLHKALQRQLGGRELQSARLLRELRGSLGHGAVT